MGEKEESYMINKLGKTRELDLNVRSMVGTAKADKENRRLGIQRKRRSVFLYAEISC